MGWSSEEHLLCIKTDGSVLVYDMFGSLLTMFSMGEESSASKIIEAKLFPSSAGTGLAVMTTKYRVFIVNSVAEPKVRQFPPLPSKYVYCLLSGCFKNDRKEIKCLTSLLLSLIGVIHLGIKRIKYD